MDVRRGLLGRPVSPMHSREAAENLLWARGLGFAWLGWPVCLWWQQRKLTVPWLLLLL